MFFMKKRKGRAVSTHRASYPDPLVVVAGEALAPGDRESPWKGWTWCTNREGQGAWFPNAFLQVEDDDCTAARDYDSGELDVEPGDSLEVGEEVGGWLWCTDSAGRSGWLPADAVEP